MPSIDAQQIPPPKNWQDFERLCRDLWAEIWGDPNAQANGRSGQQQHGVDVSGRPGGGPNWAGVQCKGKTEGYGAAVTVKELRAEVVKAQAFKPSLREFVMATTAPKDTKIEEEARVITASHQGGGLFSVHVWGWEDVSQALCRYPALLDKHYPNLGPTLHTIARTVATLDARLPGFDTPVPDVEAQAVTVHRQRLTLIRKRETPVAVEKSPTVVLHLLPTVPGRFDLTPLNKAGVELMPPIAYVHWAKRFNHDGLLAFWPEKEASDHSQYLHVWKSGGIELVDTYAIQRIHADQPVLFPLNLERDVVQFIEYWVDHILRPLGVPHPRVACLSIFGVNGFELHEDHRPPYRPKPTFDRDVLTFSPVLVVENADIRKLFKPVFDELWQAAGKERSMGYTPGGDWIPDVHPRR